MRGTAYEPSEGLEVTVSANEPDPNTGQGGNVQPDNNQGHPAWQEILNVVPEEFHPLLEPKLKDWDQKVQGKFEDFSKYDVYKPLVENNVSLDTIQQALYMAQLMETQPETLVAQAIEHYNLEKFKPQQVAPNTDPEEDLSELGDLADLDADTLKKHPAFKEFFEKQEQINQWYENQQQSAQQDEATQYMENYLKELHEKHDHGDLAFDDLYVTALMANGFDGDQAAAQYMKMITDQATKLAQASGQQQIQPPVVLNGTGTAGSGIPENTVKLGEMKDNEVNDLVEQFIKAQQQQNQ